MKHPSALAPVVLMLAAGLGGCVSVLPDAGPAPDIYRLSAPMNDAARSAATLSASERLPWGIVVTAPSAPRALATDRIAVVRDGEHVSYAADARWSAPAPQMLQDYLIEAFEADAQIAAAVRPDDLVSTRFELRTEIIKFESVYPDDTMSGSPSATLSLRARLVDRQSRELVATRRIDVAEPADDNRMGAITEAFGRALEQASGQIVDWAVAQGARAASEVELAAPTASVN